MLCYGMFILCLCYVYALKGFILRLKICIKRETALPRLQGLKKKLLICEILKIGLKSVGTMKSINFFMYVAFQVWK